MAYSPRHARLPKGHRLPCVFGKPANAPDGPWRPEENRWWASRHKVDFDFFRFLPAIDCRECDLGRRERN